MRIAVVALALISGCFSDLPGNGALKCNYAGGRVCPAGFDCAEDRRCYRRGELPDLFGADVAGADDAAVVEDLSLADLAGADLSVPDSGPPDGGGRPGGR